MIEAFVDLRGARTWYGEAGGGPPLVMLHPGGVDSRAFGPNVDALAKHFHVWLPERRGHGRTPDTDASYSYDAGADDTIQFLEQVVGGPAPLLGMSDGAIVALHVALKRPDLVERLVFAGGVFHTDAWLPGVLVAPDQSASAFERKLYAMHTSGPRLTRNELTTIRCRISSRAAPLQRPAARFPHARSGPHLCADSSRVIIKLSSRINQNEGIRLMCSTRGDRIVRRTEVRVCRIEFARNVNSRGACWKRPVKMRG